MKRAFGSVTSVRFSQHHVVCTHGHNLVYSITQHLSSSWDALRANNTLSRRPKRRSQAAIPVLRRCESSKKLSGGNKRGRLTPNKPTNIAKSGSKLDNTEVGKPEPPSLLLFEAPTHEKVRQTWCRKCSSKSSTQK